MIATNLVENDIADTKKALMYAISADFNFLAQAARGSEMVLTLTRLINLLKKFEDEIPLKKLIIL